MQKFIPIILDNDETARCPDKSCTFNRCGKDFGKRGFTGSANVEDGIVKEIYCIYCPYCRAHLIIDKEGKN